MTRAYVTSVVQGVLREYGLSDTLLSVGALPFSWEVVLRHAGGPDQHVIIPSGPLRSFVRDLRAALDPQAAC
jgi:hypothetical protein